MEFEGLHLDIANVVCVRPADVFYFYRQDLFNIIMRCSYFVDSLVLDSNMMACLGPSPVLTAATPCPCYQDRSVKTLRREAKVSSYY